MEELEAHDDFGSVEAALLDRESAQLLDVVHEVAAVHELHHEEEV